MEKQEPYLKKETTTVEYIHNPMYPSDRLCTLISCQHPYYRHFDTYDDMYPVGCKYCDCFEFQEEDPNVSNR